jgi:cell division protein FtsW
MGIDKNIRGIIFPVGFLIGVGILMVYSSSAFISTERYGNSFHFFGRHLVNVFIGISAMIVFMKIDYQRFRLFVMPFLIFSFVLLILVFLPGIGRAAGAQSDVKRWIYLGFFNFQPSELVKLSLILFLADYICINSSRMKDLRYGVIIPLAVVAIFQGVILLQPDFGSVMILSILSFTLLFAGGIRWKYLFGVAGIFLPVIAVGILSAPYRITRILCFLNPWREPQGCGFQLIQSFIAFGRGGITGVGFGGSKQKLFFLPEAHTDFIFSLLGEEAGLIGVIVVLCMFFYLLVKLFGVAFDAKDVFGYYLALGLTVMIGSQAMINLAVSVGLMPTKGLPLPFISYGGSSFLVNMAAVGILLNITGKNRTSLPVTSVRIDPKTRYRIRIDSLYNKSRFAQRSGMGNLITFYMRHYYFPLTLFSGAVAEKNK